jgi:hypothetical protein
MKGIRYRKNIKNKTKNKYNGETNCVNFGHSNRLLYDDCAYYDKVFESVGPANYRLNENRIYNRDGCLSTLGPRSGYMGYGVSMPVKNQPAVAQAGAMIDIDSILSNRNVPMSKCKRGNVNPIDVTKIKVYNPQICNDFLNPMSSRLSYPAATYRDMGINRFYNLNKNPQVIYWDTAINTSLEEKDNFVEEIPKLWSPKLSLPNPKKGKPKCQIIKKCKYT